MLGASEFQWAEAGLVPRATCDTLADIVWLLRVREVACWRISRPVDLRALEFPIYNRYAIYMSLCLIQVWWCEGRFGEGVLRPFLNKFLKGIFFGVVMTGSLPVGMTLEGARMPREAC